MVYFCEINKNDDGLYIVNFPDKPNVKTCGKSEEEALLMAEDALNAIIETEISHGIPFVQPDYKNGYPVSVSYGNLIALKLRKFRGDKTQTEIARHLGMTYQSYQKLENPKKANPTIKTLEKIVKAFGGELQIEMKR
jgi:antitoxin HicB